MGRILIAVGLFSLSACAASGSEAGYNVNAWPQSKLELLRLAGAEDTSSMSYFTFIDNHDRKLNFGNLADEWLVRRSVKDDDGRWETLDTFSLAKGKVASSYGGKAFEDVIYAGGAARDASDAWHWIIRRSTDDGKTWATVDDLAQSADGHLIVREFAESRVGNIFAIGYYSSEKVVTSIVRASYDNGRTWRDVDLGHCQNCDTLGISVFVDANDNIYTAGSVGQHGAGNASMIIRVSGDQGKTWKTLSTFEVAECSYTQPQQMKVGHNGWFYSSGFASKKGLGNGGFVAVSEDRGMNWRLVDWVPQTAVGTITNYGLAVSTDGAIYTVGLMGQKGKNPKGYIRQIGPEGGKFIDVYSGNSGFGAWFVGVQMDKIGNLIVSGGSYWKTNSLASVILKLSHKELQPLP